MLRRAIPVAFAIASSAAPATAQDEAFSLDGIIVSVSPTPRSMESVANHVSILEGAELRASGVTSVAEALRVVSGIDVVRNGSFGAVTSVFMRGGESDYTLVLVDGVQVNLPGGGFDFASLTTDNVERIEVVRGPASALYGSDAMAGVVHVITRTGRGPLQGNVRVEGTSYAEPRGESLDGVRWAADVSGGGDTFGYSASLVREATDGILDFNNRNENTVVSGRVRFAPDELTRFDLSLRLADREYRFPTDGSGAVVDRNSFTFADESLAHLGLARQVSERLELELLIGLSETDGGTDDAQDGVADTLGFFGFTSLDHARRASGELRGNLELGRVVLTLGTELEEERLRSFSESASEFGTSYGRSNSERFNRAAFAHASGDLGLVSLTLGTRLEDNERFGASATWQIGVTAPLAGSRGTRLRGLLGRAIKEPTFFESFATGFATGNPDLDPERSLSWELGIEQELLEGAAALRATYFDQRFEDLIQYTFAPPAPSDPNFFNVAAADSRGLEVGAEAEAGPLRGGIEWSWLDTEVRDAGFDSGPGAAFVEGQALLRRPAHTLSANASGSVAGRGRVYARLTVVGARSDRDFATFPATPVELPSYRLLSLGGEWTLTTPDSEGLGVSVSLRADNLLDEAFEEVLGFRAPGRQVHAGFAVRFGGAG